MKTINENTTDQLIIKNSKFITLLFKINDNTNINSIINEVKVNYPKATHYCYGYITENYKKSSDDGEPSGTAGIPILNVLEKESIINILVIVVRYFGGIKLGAGGLVRAYSKAVKNAISKTNLIDLTIGYKIELNFDYDKQKEIDYLLKNCEIIEKDYSEKIKYIVLIPIDDIKTINKYNYKILNKLLIKSRTT